MPARAALRPCHSAGRPPRRGAAGGRFAAADRQACSTAVGKWAAWAEAAERVETSAHANGSLLSWPVLKQ